MLNSVMCADATQTVAESSADSDPPPVERLEAANLLRRRREKKNWSLARVVDALREQEGGLTISRTTLWHYEHAKTPIPLEAFSALSQLYGSPPPCLAPEYLPSLNELIQEQLFLDLVNRICAFDGPDRGKFLKLISDFLDFSAKSDCAVVIDSKEWIT